MRFGLNSFLYASPFTNESTKLFKKFKDWGFEPIPCSFRNFNFFGGSFHCATTDVRRRGGLESYF